MEPYNKVLSLSMMFTLLILRTKHYMINGKEPPSILLCPFLLLCVFSTSHKRKIKILP